MGTNEVSGPVSSTGGFYLESPSLLEFVLWVADLIQVTAILPEQGRGVRSRSLSFTRVDVGTEQRTSRTVWRRVSLLLSDIEPGRRIS